jgi:hypothetical protein
LYGLAADSVQQARTTTSANAGWKCCFCDLRFTAVVGCGKEGKSLVPIGKILNLLGQLFSPPCGAEEHKEKSEQHQVLVRCSAGGRRAWWAAPTIKK